MISKLSTLCPNLEDITLHGPPRDTVITDAVSELLLACNRDTLRTFQVDSPLTEEAREVVYRLPKLSNLGRLSRDPRRYPRWSFQISPQLTSNIAITLIGCKGSVERHSKSWRWPDSAPNLNKLGTSSKHSKTSRSPHLPRTR